MTRHELLIELSKKIPHRVWAENRNKILTFSTEGLEYLLEKYTN